MKIVKIYDRSKLRRFTDEKVVSLWHTYKEEYRKLIDKRVDIYDNYGILILKRHIRIIERGKEKRLYRATERLRKEVLKRFKPTLRIGEQ